ncbi:MAG: ester cyclase [Ignavibacteriaceae bacterium]
MSSKFFNAGKKGFSNAKCEIKNMVTNDNYVVTEFNSIGTYDGILETPKGKISPTRRKVNIPFVEIFKLKNGKIDSSKLYFDSSTMMEQAGVSIHEELVA